MATASFPERPAPRPGIVGPLVVIGLGLTFLLRSLGLVDMNIWLALLRLWPILVIAVGLDILIGRRSLSRPGAARQRVHHARLSDCAHPRGARRQRWGWQCSDRAGVVAL